MQYRVIGRNTVPRIRNSTGSRRTRQMVVALPPGAVIRSINALDCDCDCGLDHEMIRVRV